MGRFFQAIMGVILIIAGLLGIWGVFPSDSEVIPWTIWGVGMIISAMSWR